MQDARATLTPELDLTQPARLLLVDLGAGKNRLGGSCWAQVHAQCGGEPADLDSPSLLLALFTALRELKDRGRLLLAYHDRSDGGVLLTVLEMAFASRCGLAIDLGTGSRSRRRVLCRRTRCGAAGCRRRARRGTGYLGAARPGGTRAGHRRAGRARRWRANHFAGRQTNCPTRIYANRSGGMSARSPRATPARVPRVWMCTFEPMAARCSPQSRLELQPALERGICSASRRCATIRIAPARSILGSPTRATQVCMRA